MLDLLRTYRLLRTVLALVVMGSVAVPLAAPACAAAMHQQEGVEHEAVYEHPSMERACCCDHQHSPDHQPEAPCPKEAETDVEQHHAATPCCTVGTASTSDEARNVAAIAAAPQVPTLTLSRLAVAPQPEAPNVPPRRSANDASDPPGLGGVERHVFIATFLI